MAIPPIVQADNDRNIYIYSYKLFSKMKSIIVFKEVFNTINEILLCTITISVITAAV